MEKFLEMISSKEKELQSQLQALAAKKEAKMKEAELRYNKVVTYRKNQINRVDFFQLENDKLAKVIFSTIFVFWKNSFLFS